MMRGKKAAAKKRATRDNGPPKKRPGRPEKYTKEQMIDALQRSHGLVESASRLLGCPSHTVRAYMERYPEIDEVRLEEKELLKDVAEIKLLSKINSGDMTAIIFFLKTQAKDRGYTERQEWSGPGGGPIEVDWLTFLMRAHELRQRMRSAGRPPVVDGGVDRSGKGLMAGGKP